MTDLPKLETLEACLKAVEAVVQEARMAAQQVAEHNSLGEATELAFRKAQLFEEWRDDLVYRLAQIDDRVQIEEHGDAQA